jgi:hypothetical protein
MKTRALRASVCCGTMVLLAAGCDGSDSGNSNLDGSGSEAGNPVDASDSSSSRDVAIPGTDAPDAALAADGLAADGPAIEPSLDAPIVVPTLDGPSVVPSVDGADVGPTEDAPLAGQTEAGAVSGIDGQPGEAGILPPLVYPDGGLSCGLAGAPCQSAADCCGLACVANRCAAAACLSDGTPCSADGECCSTRCGAAGTCEPLNTTCKTAGNACTGGAECCSGVCNADNQCAQPGQVSYCAQVGDICRADSQCCTGVCNIAAGATAGTCALISTTCVIDGTVCNGCGECCSHFCGPFGVGGPDICQPASGCHVEGDLCRADTDCCGGDPRSGLPGAGLVRCEPDPIYGSRIGKCGGPKASNCNPKTDVCSNACNPEGNVCHYKETAICEGATTSKRNDCCACISGKDCCQLDRAGIPRCNALDTCVPAGGFCSFSGECCDNLPCVPDPVTGQLVCGASCVPLGGPCTTNADCCTGMLCEVLPGSLVGVCTIPTTPPQVVPDGGVVVEPDGGATEPDAPPPPVCAYFGQACSPTVICCSGMTCVNSSFFACTAADSSCFCFSGE